MVGASACLKMTLSGASISMGSATWCWLDENYRVVATIGVIIGAAVGLAGLYLQHRINNKRYAIEHAEHLERMRQLRNFSDS